MLLYLTSSSRPEERTEEDLLDILEEMNHLKAFAHLSTSARSQLCRVVSMERLATTGAIRTLRLPQCGELNTKPS